MSADIILAINNTGKTNLRFVEEREKMRRAEREIKTVEGILAVVDKCKICRLGLNDEGEVYIVPLSFGYVYEQETLTLYFHGATQGRKLDIMGRNPRVGFEMDCSYKIREGETACEATGSYESVIGVGKAEIVENIEEKIKGLNYLMLCQTGREYPIREEMARAVTVWKVTAEHFTGKAHL